MTASLGAAIAGAIARGVGGSASAARGARAGFALAEFLHEADQSESRGGRIRSGQRHEVRAERGGQAQAVAPPGRRRGHHRQG